MNRRLGSGRRRLLAVGTQLLAALACSTLATSAFATDAPAPGDAVPSITLGKTSDKQAYLPGETARYALIVTNTGSAPLPLTQLTVSDAMLTDLAPAAPTPTEIAPGGTHTWTGSRAISPRDCGPLTNHATAKVHAKSDKYVTALTEASPSAAAEATHTVTVVCTAALAITKAADKPVYSPGETVTYRITVTNAGTTALPTRRITVTDPTLPALAPAAPLPAELAPGAPLVFVGTRVVTAADCGPVVNTATVRYDPKSSPKQHRGKDRPVKYTATSRSRAGAATATLRSHSAPTKSKKSSKKSKRGKKQPPTPHAPKHDAPAATPIEASASATVTVLCATNLTITKTADKPTYVPGETITYTVTVTNTGTLGIPTGQIQLADPSLPGLVAATPVPAELAPAASIVFTGSRPVTVAECGVVTNVATVATPGDANPSDNTATVTVTVAGGPCAPVVVGAPAPPTTTLSVDKVGVKTLRSNERVPYVITVKNRGTVPATAVTVTDRIPAGLVAARVPKGATIADGVITWNVGDLQPGQSVRVGVWMKRTGKAAVRICNNAATQAGNAVVVADRACTRFLRVAGVRRIPVTG